MFYDNFDRLAKVAGMSASSVCVAAGLDKNRSSYWKKHGSLPTEEQLGRLADVISCEVADFFRPDGPKKFSNEVAAFEDMLAREEAGGLTENEMELLKLFRACNKKQQMQMMVEVYDFAEKNSIEYAFAKL